MSFEAGSLWVPRFPHQQVALVQWANHTGFPDTCLIIWVEPSLRPELDGVRAETSGRLGLSYHDREHRCQICIEWIRGSAVPSIRWVKSYKDLRSCYCPEELKESRAAKLVLHEVQLHLGCDWFKAPKISSFQSLGTRKDLPVTCKV